MCINLNCGCHSMWWHLAANQSDSSWCNNCTWCNNRETRWYVFLRDSSWCNNCTWCNNVQTRWYVFLRVNTWSHSVRWSYCWLISCSRITWKWWHGESGQFVIGNCTGNMGHFTYHIVNAANAAVSDLHDTCLVELKTCQEILASVSA